MTGIKNTKGGILDATIGQGCCVGRWGRGKEAITAPGLMGRIGEGRRV